MIDKTLAHMIDETLRKYRKCLVFGAAKCLNSL